MWWRKNLKRIDTITTRPVLILDAGVDSVIGALAETDPFSSTGNSLVDSLSIEVLVVIMTDFDYLLLLRFTKDRDSS